ncbi:MAG: helix-turn-helix domain-containing protein [Defluviitaleaceae bacterium]|nr:helix-turn-helix domain-containing protein [Defluviitaleaceae bacterium]
MNIYNLGTAIKNLRIQKRLTQHELAYPVINRATLSKIENGQVEGDKDIIKFLFERLGYKPKDFLDLFYNDSEDIQTHKKLKELKSYTNNTHYISKNKNNVEIVNKIDSLINELQQNKNFMQNILNKQIIYMATIDNIVNKTYGTNEFNFENIINSYKNALIT